MINNNFDKYLADISNPINRKKKTQNDIIRLQNIHKKINRFIPLLKLKTSPKNEKHEVIPNIYQFNGIQSSVNVNFDISRDDEYFKNIPKIQVKEISIPHYSDNDNFDLNKINQNISTPIHMDIFVSDNINDGDVNRVKNKKIYKIIHIYQQKYSDNVSPTG